MTRTIRALLAAMALLVAFGAFTSTAPALNIAPAGNITMTSQGTMVIDSTIDIDCNVTFTGDLLATASNRAGTAIGAIEGASFANCDGAGGAQGLVGPGEPWQIRLVAAWSGPGNNLLVYFDNARINISDIAFINSCLYLGNPQFSITTALDGTTGLATSSQTGIPFVEGEDICPATMRLVGTFGITQLNIDL